MENRTNKIVTILEVGFGNLPSLDRVLNQLNIGTKNVESVQDILEAEHLIIPGVGSFETAMNYLNQNIGRSLVTFFFPLICIYYILKGVL